MQDFGTFADDCFEHYRNATSTLKVTLWVLDMGLFSLLHTVLWLLSVWRDFTGLHFSGLPLKPRKLPKLGLSRIPAQAGGMAGSWLMEPWSPSSCSLNSMATI